MSSQPGPKKAKTRTELTYKCGHKREQVNKYEDTSIFLKNISYGSMYAQIMERELFNILMVDGAVLQIQYLFENQNIKKHRLAFFPSPSLEEFQNNSDVYEIDELYSDIIMKSIYPSPLRFDFDLGAAIDLQHPMSHLTIGQYGNCRIPVAAPLSPYLFIHFILSAFYNTGYRKYCGNLKHFPQRFAKTITENEAAFIYIGVPG